MMRPRKILWTIVVFIAQLASLEGHEGPGFQKLKDELTISFGDPSAPIHVTDYFSFSCPVCLESIKKDFPYLKEKYIDTKKVYWIFHPDPVDITTLQALVCFSKLDSIEKQFFFNQMIASKKTPKPVRIMQTLMAGYGKSLPLLGDLKFLEQTEVFNDAYSYVKQNGIPSSLPTVEINGVLHKEFPTREFLENIFLTLNVKSGGGL